MKRSPTRRQLLRSTALAGTVAIAGCSTANREPDAASTSTTSSTSTNDSETTATTTTESTLTPPESIDDWLANANGYRGDALRYGLGSQPLIEVGHPVEDGLSFDPPVIEVAPMTNVTWDWTGHGGLHNIVALDGTFDSGRPNAQSGTSYHYIFEEPGTYPFVSEPHRDEGMRGAVFVKEPPSTGNQTVDRWVGDSSNFDGTVVDRTDVDTATVSVGTRGNRGHFAFDPPVLKITTGTTVEWNWTGTGGGHNVVFLNSDIHSGQVTPESGVHFRHTFEQSGTYRYACQPHRSLDQKGAIIVE
ncbi:halocyanin domain-containing protein [Haloferax volcanii]|uniref:halocyanin domain-containing protein n=1 Tax=Haloferax volcanii TaxID=2246 RepID=UPI00385C67BE